MAIHATKVSVYELIYRENPLAVENDLNLIGIAKRKSWCEDGWEDLQSRCLTKAGKEEIRQIEIRKYRREERESDMM